MSDKRRNGPTLIRVGHALPTPYQALCQDFLKRLRPALRIIELPPSVHKGLAGLRDEADRILKICPPKSPKIVLDMGGNAYSSVNFAAALETWGNHPTFIIGGAEGHHPDMLAAADHTLSLGLMTLPHAMAQLVLMEQLYRAQCIKQGHPYHRD